VGSGFKSRILNANGEGGRIVTLSTLKKLTERRVEMNTYQGDINNGQINVTPAAGWTAFWFESNQAWGMIHGPGDWQRIKDAYPDTDLRTAKESVSYGANVGIPYYGFRHECQGPKTLGEFFAENGMEI
jgi:hypothetical protein